MNPWSVIGDVIVGLIKERKLEQWIKVLFQILTSSLVSFLFVTGTTLVSTRSWQLSVGSGLLISAVVIVAFVRRSPMTKGMMFIFPAGEAEKELNTNIETIIRDK